MTTLTSLQCQCKDSTHWHAHRFGNGFVILCSACGLNASERAEKEIGLNNRDDDIDMANSSLDLIRYERNNKMKDSK